MKIKFGDRVKDEITGFCGVVVGKVEWAYETYPKFGVSSEVVNNTPLPVQWFEEPRLNKLPKKKVSRDVEEVTSKKRGRKSKKEVSEVVLRPDEDKPKKRGRKARKRIERELDNGQI